MATPPTATPPAVVMAGTSQRCAGRPRQTTRSDARSAAAYAAPRPAVAAPIASGASGAQVGWTAAGGGADAVSWAAAAAAPDGPQQRFRRLDASPRRVGGCSGRGEQ